MIIFCRIIFIFSSYRVFIVILNMVIFIFIITKKLTRPMPCLMGLSSNTDTCGNEGFVHFSDFGSFCLLSYTLSSPSPPSHSFSPGSAAAPHASASSPPSRYFLTSYQGWLLILQSGMPISTQGSKPKNETFYTLIRTSSIPAKVKRYWLVRCMPLFCDDIT